MGTKKNETVGIAGELESGSFDPFAFEGGVIYRALKKCCDEHLYVTLYLNNSQQLGGVPDYVDSDVVVMRDMEPKEFRRTAYIRTKDVSMITTPWMYDENDIVGLNNVVIADFSKDPDKYVACRLWFSTFAANIPKEQDTILPEPLRATILEYIKGTGFDYFYHDTRHVLYVDAGKFNMCVDPMKQIVSEFFAERNTQAQQEKQPLKLVTEGKD